MDKMLKIVELLSEDNAQKIKDEILEEMLDYIIDDKELFEDVRREVILNLKNKMVDRYTSEIEEKFEELIQKTDRLKGEPVGKKMSERVKHCLDGNGCDKCDCYEVESALTCRKLLQAAYEWIKKYEDLEDGKNGDISRWIFPETAKKCIEYMQAYMNSEKPRKLEREDKSMLHNVIITKSENKVLEECWIMKAEKKEGKHPSSCLQSSKEKELNHEPTIQEIVQFLSDSNADFVSVEHNYRFKSNRSSYQENGRTILHQRVNDHFYITYNQEKVANGIKEAYIQGAEDCVGYLLDKAWHVITESVGSYPKCYQQVLVEDDHGDNNVAYHSSDYNWYISNGERSFKLTRKVVKWIELVEKAE